MLYKTFSQQSIEHFLIQLLRQQARKLDLFKDSETVSSIVSLCHEFQQIRSICITPGKFFYTRPQVLSR
jgi:hypothetical protein